jgi:hypothetical protein
MPDMLVRCLPGCLPGISPIETTNDVKGGKTTPRAQPTELIRFRGNLLIERFEELQQRGDELATALVAEELMFRLGPRQRSPHGSPSGLRPAGRTAASFAP